MIFEITEKLFSIGYGAWQKKQGPIDELEGLKLRLKMTAVTNLLDEPIRAIREFFVRHPQLLQKYPENRQFVERWAMNPYLQAWGSVPGMWTRDSLDQLNADTAALRAK